jgi:hypothetical protein
MPNAIMTNFSIKIRYKGEERTTELPLTKPMISRLALVPGHADLWSRQWATHGGDEEELSSTPAWSSEGRSVKTPRDQTRNVNCSLSERKSASGDLDRMSEVQLRAAIKQRLEKLACLTSQRTAHWIDADIAIALGNRWLPQTTCAGLGQALTSEAIAECIRSGGVREAESNI